MHPVEVLANRIVWSLLLVTAVLAWQGRWGWLRKALRHPKTLLGFVASCKGAVERMTWRHLQKRNLRKLQRQQLAVVG